MPRKKSEQVSWSSGDISGSEINFGDGYKTAPAVAGAVTGIVVNPVMGRVVEAARDAAPPR